MPRQLPGVRAKRGKCLLFFLSMGICLAQVSKKLHSTILNSFEANLAATFWPWLLEATPSLDPELSGPVSFSAQQIHFSFYCNTEPTRSAVLTPKEAKEVTAGSELPQMELAPLTCYQNCFVNSYLPNFCSRAKFQLSRASLPYCLCLLIHGQLWRHHTEERLLCLLVLICSQESMIFSNVLFSAYHCYVDCCCFVFRKLIFFQLHLLAFYLLVKREWLKGELINFGLSIPYNCLKTRLYIGKCCYCPQN